MNSTDSLGSSSFNDGKQLEDEKGLETGGEDDEDFRRSKFSNLRPAPILLFCGLTAAFVVIAVLLITKQLRSVYQKWKTEEETGQVLDVDDVIAANAFAFSHSPNANGGKRDGDNVLVVVDDHGNVYNKTILQDGADYQLTQEQEQQLLLQQHTQQQYSQQPLHHNVQLSNAQIALIKAAAEAPPTAPQTSLQIDGAVGGMGSAAANHHQVLNPATSRSGPGGRRMVTRTSTVSGIRVPCLNCNLIQMGEAVSYADGSCPQCGWKPQ